MWTTIASLKDNFAQIANDVLDTADELENEEDLKGTDVPQNHQRDGGSAIGADGLADLELHEDVDLNVRHNADIEAELRWYKAEVQRLSANDSDIQALSTNYSNLLRERELDIQQLREQNEKLDADLRTARQEVVSQEESKRLQEKIKAISDELQRAADAHQEQLAALQDHHRQQTSTLLLKHKKELEDARAEAAESAKPHESNGFLSPEESTKNVEDAMHQAQNVEKALRRAHEKEEDLLGQITEREQANSQLQALFEQSKAESTKLKERLASQEAAHNEARKQLQQKVDEFIDVSKRVGQLQAERDQLVAEVRRWRVGKEEAETAAKILREQLQEAVTQRESLGSQLKAEKAELEMTSRAGLKEADKLRDRLLRVEQEAAALSTADAQRYELEAAKARAEHEKALGELQRTIALQEEKLGALMEQKEREGVAAGASGGEEEVLARLREEVEVLRERLRSSEEASSRQTEEHERELARVLEEKDKAKRDLARLKQHLLDKAEEESDKMSEDSARIANLEARCSEVEVRRKELEELLTVTTAELDKERATSSQDVRATTEEVSRLKAELEEALATVSSKDMELVNLNSALGQYYAETEAKERLQGELHQAREDLARLAKELEASQKAVSDKETEKQRIAEQIAATESRVIAAEKAKSKYQDEVDRMRKALEQSMTRIHRMSSDSDQYVDRRIVIKLLITYFEKRHSAEALDLMARILGFTEEDKKRVGLAKAGLERRGVVSGVLGAPGRIVGAVFGGASAPSSPRASISDRDPSSATFTDLWIDFLLKESQQQEEQRRIDERAAEERRTAAALSDEPFTLPRSRSSLSPQSSISAANLPGVYNPSHNSVYANQVLSPTSGALPGVYYASTLSPKQAIGLDNGDRRRTSILDSDGFTLPSPRGSGYQSGGEFSSVPLNSSTGQK